MRSTPAMANQDSNNQPAVGMSSRWYIRGVGRCHQPLVVLVLSALCGSACDEASITISFAVPEAYRDRVETVSLQLLVPPAGEQFGCDDIAFQEVSEELLAASRIQEVRVSRRDSVDLTEIPRLGPKLFYLRGLAVDEVAIVAACAELGDIDGDVAVELVGEPVVAVSLPDHGYGRPLPERIDVTVSDIDGEAVADVDLRWMVTGPGSFDLQGSARTDAAGSAVVAIANSTLPGPAAFDLQARWQRGAADAMIGFVAAPTIFAEDLPAQPDALVTGRTEYQYQVGRIGPAGEMGFAALGPATVGMGRQVYVVYYDSSISPSPFHVAATAPLTGVSTLGLASAGSRDQLIAISASAWIEINADGTTVSWPSPAPGRTAARIVPAGACSGSGNDVILVGFIDEGVAAFDSNRAPVASALADQAPSARIHASGCVDDVGGAIYRTVVFINEGFDQELLVHDTDSDTIRHGAWETYAAGIGFVGVADEHLLIGPRVTIEGSAIARYQLVKIGSDEVDLDLVAEDAAPTLFYSAPGGDVDGDGLADVVALLDFGGSDGITQYRLLVALGRTHRDQRIVGLSGANSAQLPRLLLADFDGNGADDVVVATPTSAAILAMGER